MSAKSYRFLQSLVLLLALVFGTAPGLVGCYAPVADEDTESADEAATARVVERFPARAAIEQAMELYRRDPQAARARSAVSVEEFFGGRRESANASRLRVELLKPNPRYADKPIAFLRAEFHGTDMYWNNRYKDVQLYRLTEATGAHNPFPEAAHVAHEGSALVRMWTDYTPVSKGAPEGLSGEALAGELARMSVWSYVSGNVDGPAKNANNGGFAKFRDPSGRELWRGVLIDAGAAWNVPEALHKPWNTNLLERGPITRDAIPRDVVNALIQIARSSAHELAERSKFERVDEGALDIVRGIRGRAQEVLDHYGIQWRSSMNNVVPFRPRPSYVVPLREAA